MGIIRSSVSCAATPSQSIILHALTEPSLEQEKQKLYKLLEKRYRKVRAFVDLKKNHPVLEPLPFNLGYFMSFHH